MARRISLTYLVNRSVPTYEMSISYPQVPFFYQTDRAARRLAPKSFALVSPVESRMHAFTNWKIGIPATSYLRMLISFQLTRFSPSVTCCLIGPAAT